jgi:hypothetical protein
MVLVGTPERKDDIKMDFKRREWGVEWIYVA